MVKEFFIASAVAVFGFLYLWASLLMELGGPRLRRFVALLCLVSAYIAFTYRPHDASDIILKPAQALTDWFVSLLNDSLPTAPTTTTTAP